MKKRLTKLLKDGRSAAAASLPSSSSKFLANEQGAIAILAAVMLPVVIGMIALAVEFGHGLLIRDETQRVADEAAYAGALAYAATGNQTSMLSAAQNVAVLNGVATTAVAANLIASSPRDATSPAVQATITTDEPIVFGQVVGFGGSVTIKATSYAEIPSNTPPCVLALKASGAGVSLSGGTTVSAPSCVVASQASVVVPCGTHVTAKDVYYNGAAPTVGCSGITGTIKKVSTPDPLAGNAEIVAANARAVADEIAGGPDDAGNALGASWGHVHHLRLLSDVLFGGRLFGVALRVDLDRELSGGRDVQFPGDNRAGRPQRSVHHDR